MVLPEPPFGFNTTILRATEVELVCRYTRAGRYLTAAPTCNRRRSAMPTAPLAGRDAGRASRRPASGGTKIDSCAACRPHIATHRERIALVKEIRDVHVPSCVASRLCRRLLAAARTPKPTRDTAIAITPTGSHSMFSWSSGPTFGVRRPLRHLAWKLNLSEAQVRDVVDVLDRLKTAYNQARLDQDRSTSDVAAVFTDAEFNADRVTAALASTNAGNRSAQLRICSPQRGESSSC